MRTFSSVCVAASLAALSYGAQVGSATCSAVLSANHDFDSFDNKIDKVLAQNSAEAEDDDEELAQAGPKVHIPTHANLGSKMILDADQNRFLPRQRTIWNGDLSSASQGPPLNGATALSGWRFFWAGVKNSDIAVEKEQVRRLNGKLFIEHWDHVMTFPAACEHAMQVMNVHFSQIKVNQNDLEARLAIVDRENQMMKAKLGIHEQKAKVRKVKAKIVKKKLKLIISALKCKAAKHKQAAKVANKQVSKLKHALKKNVKAIHAVKAAAKSSIAAAKAGKKAAVQNVKAKAQQQIKKAVHAAVKAVKGKKGAAKTKALNKAVKKSSKKVSKAAKRAVKHLSPAQLALLRKTAQAKAIAKMGVKSKAQTVKAAAQIKAAKDKAAAAISKAKAAEAVAKASAKANKAKAKALANKIAKKLANKASKAKAAVAKAHGKKAKKLAKKKAKAAKGVAKQAKKNAKAAAKSLKHIKAKGKKSKTVSGSAIKKASKDAQMVHKFLRLASKQKDAPKGIIAVARKESVALKAGIKRTAAEMKKHKK